MLKLTPIQSQVLSGLLAGKSVSAVARENAIHRSTIYNWRHQQPYFTLVLDQAQSRQQAALYDQVQDVAEQALEAVATLLVSEDANLRLRAAQTVLKVAEPSRLPSVNKIRQNSTLNSQPSRNSHCACGSGLKYKHCCGNRRTEATNEPLTSSQKASST
jgi:transposase-like protein